ncbi:flagellar biosynthesis anti-sigma factor FlgM [Solidesulfovibrio sp.]|uniref:flagellar biosynthesis anti-sigma factor FlgM n=1 Tax=Solidesulfovibrio sp. TaxID=2910990 RepID=UPI000EBC4CDE|nr:flagellar biosynthesis anti-sigma factor FlgM [Solidesulfovibrio sp.]MEA5087985.1 flagellar biosynthesis anti-sigma factor FlgM [Solidesulfovibrio sp.]HCR12872.1 flagellar biosynthesis anti-sigma factor FlgM [Desulfovibrio sp.]HML60353.1 flagellar biosynthesis anti-sigma factor FlgM [Solidesulfovibrio sp.]
MDIKTIFGINQGYGQNRVKRGGSGETSSISRTDGGEASGASGADKVTLSGDARLVSLAATTAKDAPDTRSDRVAELKAQVEAGTYQPDSRKIAEKMLTMDSELFG